ncbi:MAG TPA: DUF1385 domain-containing protein [Terriglobia bacterium]|nr:DUF1385 domain-containing protein [Terriglobia bacterium]
MAFKPVSALISAVIRFTIFLLKTDEDVLVGGQAVFEGVMMRLPKAYSVAVRKPDGSVAVKKDHLGSLAERHKIWGLPVIRGAATLGQAFILGMRALKFSTDQALAGLRAENAEQKGEAPVKNSEVGSWAMALNIFLALVFFIFIFKYLPLLAASYLAALYPIANHHFVFSLIDGVFRLLLFLLYLSAISLVGDIRRVFEYHGAEHKVVFTYEARQVLSVENARKQPRLHPRCGTSFLLVVMILSVLVYALIPFNTFSLKLLSRIALIPLLAGFSYEIIRFGARGRVRLLGWMTKPGLWLQLITTREPKDEQLEIAIRALDETLLLEKIEGHLAVT